MAVSSHNKITPVNLRSTRARPNSTHEPQLADFVTDTCPVTTLSDTWAINSASDVSFTIGNGETFEISPLEISLQAEETAAIEISLVQMATNEIRKLLGGATIQIPAGAHAVLD